MDTKGRALVMVLASSGMRVGEADSLSSVVKDGEASSNAGAAALSVVDGILWEESFWGFIPIYLGMLDATWLISNSEASGGSSRTKVSTIGSVSSATLAHSTWTNDITMKEVHSDTIGYARESIEGKGRGYTGAVALAGSFAATDIITPVVIIEETAAARIGTDVIAIDDSEGYLSARLRYLSTSSWTSPLVSASITHGSGNSWLKPWLNKGDSSVNGEPELAQEWRVSIRVVKDVGSFWNRAYSYLSGLIIPIWIPSLPPWT